MRGTKPHLKEDPEAITDLGPPAWLSDEAADEWNRVMPILAERKILTVADLGSLENYCIATGMVREAETHIQVYGAVLDVDGVFKRNPSVGIQSDAMTRARLLAAELGLTPVSRSRPTIRDDDDDDSLVD
ncbi:phage terminase small subunit P27 family [Shimia sediminis]|uniref:phage terminase small subunit P27 family n=1 Tax=Shimia sediminis TaxID=2497945 RepID=UPI000F8E40D3|nr:phage terminase small subunit P27 family [Shimia sediminis]